ncbi:hypothetical protein ACFQJC_00905 [Haloferax namakaokahaiae]|uniref:Glycine zipper-like domain-containing protein n=1 Tax=Haloferax namakaokahaiae TaxID=1748331 RepID=A0ABD5Z9W1_9EURY
MSQESATLADEVLGQPQPTASATELDEQAVIQHELRETTSWSGEWFGIGLAIGIMLGGLTGVIWDFFPVTVMLGVGLGMVLGIVLMEDHTRQRIRSVVAS